MDIHLPRLYKDYGDYSNYRNFPLDIDGLKPVERRVLLSAFTIAKNKLVKSRQIDAYTIGHFHPHGECVVGETEISLLDGREIQIKDLLGCKPFWVYSSKESGEIVPGLAHSVRITKWVNKLYKITLDNDKYFLCDEDHFIMLRDGNYLEAKNLKIDSSLMPLYRRKEDDYTYYKDNSKSTYREEKVAWMVIRNLINDNIDNLIGFQKYHSHHKNNIRHDDSPENLDLIYYKDHCSETSKSRSKESNKIIGKKVKRAYKENKNNFKTKALNGLSKGRERMFSIAKNNHKIKNIEIINLKEEIPLYDMSVEKYHNYALSCGIFVHNCYGTVVQLVRQGFLDGQGNFGTSVGVEPVGPAAPRYTECKISPKTIDLAFKYINHVPIINTELGDKEPFYLPTMYPFCLIGTDYTQGIGFGYKTFIPCYEMKDLYQRLLWLLGIRKRKPIISPITDCNITSPASDLDELLTTGKAKIEAEGKYEINAIKNMVTLKSWPPGKRFQSLLNKFAKELNESMIGFTDLSVTSTEIVFQVIRERNRDKIFKDFVEKFEEAIKGAISFEIVLVDSNQTVIKKSVDEMLLNTYEMFSKANEDTLKYEISKINETISEYQALELIRKPLSKCIASGWDIPATLDEISNATGVSKEVTKELIGKYRINKLLTLDTDTSNLENQLKNFKNSLENLSEYVLQQYAESTR
jgi:hypothetical protein